MNPAQQSKRCRAHPDRKAEAFCVKCGAPLCRECLVRVGASPHCPACASIRAAQRRRETFPRFLPAAVTPAVRRNISGAVANKELRRLLALLFDSALVFIISIPVSFVLRFIGMLFLVPEVGGLGFFLCLYYSLFFVASLYFPLLWWRFGATPGKVLTSLKVKSVSGAPLTLLASFWRWTGLLTALIWMYVGFLLARSIVKLLSIFAAKLPLLFMLASWFGGITIALVFSLGVLIAFVGRHKRGFHDILGGSIVVSDTGGRGIPTR
ncbi:MAG: RDD family protein [bacterium]